MTTYTVIWEIEVDADNVEDAAREAQRIQRDPESDATAFHVARHHNRDLPGRWSMVDLRDPIETEEDCPPVALREAFEEGRKRR